MQSILQHVLHGPKYGKIHVHGWPVDVATAAGCTVAKTVGAQASSGALN